MVEWSVQLVPEGNDNRPQFLLKPRLITIHTTGNSDVGADALMHVRFVHNGGGDQGVSFHYVVDDKRIIQLIPHDEVAYHAGTALGNGTSIGVELCVNSDGDFNAMLANAVLLGKRLYRELELLTSVPQSFVQHRFWRVTSCPAELRANDERLWNNLIYSIASTPSQDEDMESYYQLHKERLGEKKYAGYLRKPYYSGPILVCQHGVIIPGQSELSGYIIDDWETYNDQLITKYLG